MDVVQLVDRDNMDKLMIMWITKTLIKLKKEWMMPRWGYAHIQYVTDTYQKLTKPEVSLGKIKWLSQIFTSRLFALIYLTSLVLSRGDMYGLIDISNPAQ